MSTEFYNRNWRMPNSFNGSEDNNSKFSNYSMSFDGSSEYIDLGSGFTTTNQFTISAWINPNNLTSSGYGYLLGNNSANGTGFSLDEGGGAAGAGKFYLYTGTGSISVISNTALTINNWFYVVFVCDKTVGTKGEIKFYLNGSLDKTTTLSNQDLNSLTSLEYIGYSPSHYINAKLDHFSIFDYALTQAQITALYGSSSTGVGNPMAITNGRKPVAYYPIGDYSAYNGTEYLVPNSAVSDYVFDFSSDSIEVSATPSQLSLPSTTVSSGGFSISFWYYHNTIVNFDVVMQSTNANANNGFGVWQSTTNNGLNFWVGHYLQGDLYTTNNYFTSQKWYNITCTFEGGASHTSKIFIDGVLNNSVSYTTSRNIHSGENILIGGWPLYSRFFDGKLSNTAIFNTALPATGTESVESLYNYGTPPDISSYSGLQGFWKLDASATFDGSNWSIPDSSSNSNTGTSSGMTAANLVQSNLNILSPYSRYALDFDGTGDFINCGVDSVFDFGTSDFAWSFWLNYESHTNYAGIFFTGVSSSTYRLKFQTSGQILFMQNADGDSQVADLGTDITGTGWHHIVLSRSSGTITTFLDGSQVDTDSRAGNINQGGSSFFIGRNGTSYLNGQLSNISIWNTALNQTQVTELYNSGKPSNLNSFSAYSNLISWWQLGENMSYNSNVWTVLNEISTAPNGVGSSNAPAEIAIVNGVGTSGNGISSGMGGADNIIGDAPYSTSNALSYGMGADAKSTSVPS